jgi:hypothetical protein
MPSKLTNQLICTAKLMLVGCLFAAAGGCVAQTQDVLCSDGNGSFQTAFMNTGVTVRVGPSKAGELATRTCEAVFAWNKHKLPLVTNAAQADLDAFGVDLGLGTPIAAFQVKKSDAACCREYQVYSLTEPPRLLRTITGGASYHASDTDLDGQVEIWTDDAAAVDGFETLRVAELDFAPPVILRFSRGKLLDVSPEFQFFFDNHISTLREALSADELGNFRRSDGKLISNDLSSAERIHKLRAVKMKVLEIVWSYLYSGREPQAWLALDEMWPSGDVARIRAAIVSTRAHGISTQFDGTSSVRSGKRSKHAALFNAISKSPGGKLEVRPPEPIMLHRPPLVGPAGPGGLEADSVLDLVIDSAGKVRAADAAGKAAVDSALIRATTGWKFIPAFKDGRAVACRTRISVSLRQ